MSTREQELNKALEAMYFGFRAMVRHPDEGLKKLGYSRVHHRILYFVGRNEGCSINDLLAIMGVTKQYLNRPLKKLVEDGFIEQQTDRIDKRVKRLYLTGKGATLESSLSGNQRQQFARIFEQLGEEAEHNWHQVMQLLARQ